MKVSSAVRRKIRDALGGPPAKSKYGNRKTTVGGLKFDSKREASRWLDLLMLLDQGKIFGLRRQVPFRLVVQGMFICRYRADFVYIEAGALVVEDTKGFKTADYKIKRALMKACFGIDIKET